MSVIFVTLMGFFWSVCFENLCFDYNLFEPRKQPGLTFHWLFNRDPCNGLYTLNIPKQLIRFVSLRVCILYASDSRNCFLSEFFVRLLEFLGLFPQKKYR